MLYQITGPSVLFENHHRDRGLGGTMMSPRSKQCGTSRYKMCSPGIKQCPHHRDALKNLRYNLHIIKRTTLKCTTQNPVLLDSLLGI